MKRQERLQAWMADGVRRDVAEAAARLSMTLGSKRDIRALQRYLLQGELVRELTIASKDDKQGVLALTNQRLIYLFEGFVNGDVEDLPLGNTTAVSHRTKGLDDIVSIHASGKVIQLHHVHDAQVFSAAARAALVSRAQTPHVAQGDPAIPASAPTSATTPDLIDQIKRLGELRDSGLLTEEEFAAKKRSLLDRL